MPRAIRRATVTNRAIRRAVVALFACVALLVASARGDAGDDRGAPCKCADTEACYHYLNAPVAAPDGPCPCPACVAPRVHDGATVPAGWNRECFASRDVDCFLKRHSASWRLVCSACIADTKCCTRPNPERCPSCQDGDAKSPFPKDAAATARERLAVERKVFTKSEPIVVLSRHFYVVTDIRSIRVHLQGGGWRVATGHEYAHIAVQRAEQAYREFRAAFGAPSVGRGTGIFIPSSETTARDLQGVYFRSPRSHMVYSSYGGSSESAISEGYCLNGFCISGERFADDDLKLHQALRHLLGNIFLTNWVVTNGEARTSPPWAFEGLAHWLGKRPEALRDQVYYCEGEQNEVRGSGRNWLEDVTAAARSGALRPIDEILATRALGKLEYRDFQQVWGWFHVAMEDCPKPWAALLESLRRETEVHEAFRKAFGFPAREFQARFIARLTGARASLLDGPAPQAAPPDASRGSRAEVRAVAARIRATPPPTDRAGVKALLDEASHADAIREAAYTALLGVAAPAAREAIWTDGLVSADPMVRAYAARLCRELRIAEAKPALRRALDDSSWLVRAEAALASLAVRDFDAQARVREMLADKSPKARIGATDALRLLGKDLANPACLPPIVANLAHADWQVRVAACQALAVLGDVASVRPLIERMPVEGGRVAEEIRLALRGITGDDLGARAEDWKKWWDRVEPDARDRGIEKPKTRPSDERYGIESKEHGIQLDAFRLGFVVDTSRSTNRRFTPDEETARRYLGGATQASIQEVMRGVIQAALRGRDARTRFGLWAFGTDVSAWNARLVTATRENVDSAVGFVRARSPDGETNLHLALRCALDVREGDDYLAGFRDTPDTVLILTDGTPSEGDITDPDVFIRWFTELNRYSRVRVHTLAVGSLEVDERLLDALATRNWGTFVQIREQNPR